MAGNMSVEPKELGTLIVVVGKARNLPNKSRFGKQDPFCCVTINEEKQRTKAIKRGGQHPEWDHELRFTIFEDVDDVLTRSESTPDTSLSSSTSGPSITSKDTPSAPGVITSAALANKSRKGPINRKGGKSMKVACYADDAKEPELIGEVIVPIDEVLKKGEVDEWYEFLYKDKYSGEIYLELTFYSNDVPPVKRNVPRPPIHNNYGGAGVFDPHPSGNSLAIANKRMSGGLPPSGSITGMSLYIPPYAQPARGASPAPSHLPPSSSFNDLGLPPGHVRKHSLPQTLPHQPGYPPLSISSVSSMTSTASTSTITPQHLGTSLDALTRPMTSMSLGPSYSSRPLPTATPAPQAPPGSASGHPYVPHRHSVSGQSEAPWASLMPQAQTAPAPPHQRPMSTNDAQSWEHQQRLEALRMDAPTPIIHQGQGQGQGSYAPPHQSYTPAPDAYQRDYRAPSPIPPSLAPPGPPDGQPKPHPNSFSGHVGESHYYQPSPSPRPPPQPNVAPPDAQSSSHYQMSTLSFGGLPQPSHELPRAHSPGPGYHAQSATSSNTPYDNGVGYQSVTPTPQSHHGHHQSRPSYGDEPSRSNSYPPQHTHGDPSSQYGAQPSYQSAYPPEPFRAPQPSHASPAVLTPAPQPYGYNNTAPPERQPSPMPAESARQNSSGYVPWYMQTEQRPPPPPPSAPTPAPYGYQAPSQSQPSPQSYGPPPVPEYRPIPNPPPPPRQSVGYYPSDELYAEQRQPPPPPAPTQGHWQQQQQQPQQQPQQPSSSYAQSHQQAFQPPPPSSSFSAQPSHTPNPVPYHPVQDTPPRAPAGWQSTVNQPYRAPPSPSPTSIPQLYNPPYQSQDTFRPPRSPSPQPPAQPYQPLLQGDWQSQSQSITPSNHTLAPPGGSSALGPQADRRSPSPSLNPGRQDWKAYMQGLGGSLPPRSPSPQPPPKQWYTPPPSLPASIRPPDGWRSTLPAQMSDGHQWRT